MKKLLLIDANALVHRAFHALPPLTTKGGKPAGALYGLANIMLKIFRDNPPQYAAALFDRPEPTFRKEIFNEYKIHRPKAPDELISQIIEAHNLFDAFGVKTYEAPGFEADDLIGTAAKKFKSEEDLQIVILTGDLDTLQIVDDDKVVVETLKKGISETIIYNADAVRQRFQISPLQITDYKGLVGDASDNIPGIKGVGPKTAAEIINKYGNLENFFQTLEKGGVENEKYQKFLEHKKDALFSKHLATLHFEAPFDVEKISEVKFSGIDAEKVVNYFKKLGFQSLIKRINQPTPNNPLTGGLTGRATNDLQPTTKTENKERNEQLSISERKVQPHKIMEEIEKPLTPILKELENWGIKVSNEKLKNHKTKLDEELKELTKKIYEESGAIFNINSPKQLLAVLKDKFRLKITSTNHDKLVKFKDAPIINLILRYRELFKLKTTYIEPLLELSQKENRIHPTFVQLKAATGRITCENPNLQNIPESVREIFIPENGFKLASFDYSQVELRILATLSDDEKMIEAFEKGADIHQMTASQIFNVAPESVTNHMRKIAKTLNFGIVYGMGARSFAQESGLDFNEAKKFISEYFDDFPSIKKWQEIIILKARQTGFIENINGRIRELPELVSFNQRIQAEAERMAVNFPVQSLAADIIKIAMIKTKEKLVEKNFWGNKAKMLLTIHDELVFEILDDLNLNEIVGLINKTMESVYALKVPLIVNAKIGNSWGEI